MRVIEYERYGGPEVLQQQERAAPIVGPGEIVVRVRAAALNPKDVLVRAGKFPRFAGKQFPKRVGYDWSGQVVEIGPGVNGVRMGEARYGMIQSWAAGACAEYAAVRVEESAPMPAGLSWEEAAALPLASLTALQALRDLGTLSRGKKVLINGASGGVGVYAVQLAKALGGQVTTLTSQANQEFVRALGADETLDYAAGPLSRGARFDVFFDVFGNSSYRKALPHLAPRGVYISTVPGPRIVAEHLLTALLPKKAKLVVVRSRARDLDLVRGLVEKGMLRPVVDRVLPLDQCEEAHRYLSTKRARGKVVLRID